jgi:hypothetical protein
MKPYLWDYVQMQLHRVALTVIALEVVARNDHTK